MLNYASLEAVSDGDFSPSAGLSGLRVAFVFARRNSSAMCDGAGGRAADGTHSPSLESRKRNEEPIISQRRITQNLAYEVIPGSVESFPLGTVRLVAWSGSDP